VTRMDWYMAWSAGLLVAWLRGRPGGVRAGW